jgi:hypothetical protein
MVPQPVVAVLLLFPITKATDAAAKEGAPQTPVGPPCGVKGAKALAPGWLDAEGSTSRPIRVSLPQVDSCVPQPHCCEQMLRC